jgi:hypothetical protein
MIAIFSPALSNADASSANRQASSDAYKGFENKKARFSKPCRL